MREEIDAAPDVLVGLLCFLAFLEAELVRITIVKPEESPSSDSP